MKKILLIDDSKTILNALKMAFEKSIDTIEIITADSFNEANKVIRANKEDIFMAVVDLNLPDCAEGQAVLLTNSHKIPTIILSSSDNSELKELLLKKDVIDFVCKDSEQNIVYVVSVVSKMLRNSTVCALVVDDSTLYRQNMKQDLEKLHITVIEARDGEEGLAVMQESKEKISLVLTDYNMPKLDGIGMTVALRNIYGKDELAIIALSATEDEDALAEFIKSGANDFVSKPHQFQELNVRINSNLDLLDLFEKTKDLANRDYLTGSYNRRYFFEVSEAIIAKSMRKKVAIAVATLDIDNFKNVNDSFGHDVGDRAIQEIARILKETLRTSDLVARFGGEEYSILLEDISFEDTKTLFEKIRINFENNVLHVNELEIRYTVSIGVAYAREMSIDRMLKLSDEALYEAKESGRNKVVIKNIS